MTTLLNYQLFLPDDASARELTPLFILHGLLGSLDNWRSQAKRFSQLRPVYIIDLRNHGDSPHLKGMSYREMYEDVLNIAQHESITSLHLLGHSMGGKVAMQLAIAQESIVKSLTVVDIAPKPYPLWHQKTLQGVLSAPLAELHSRQEVDEYLKPWIEDSAERTFMLKNLKRGKTGFSWRCNLKEISRGYLKIAGFPSALEQYTKPCLFLKGAQSNYIQEIDHGLIRSLFPEANIVSLDDSGHLPHIQQADDFYQQVSSFLN